MAATMYYVTWVMGQAHFATLFISLGLIGMMFGSMLAKVLTDRWCKLKVFFWTNIALAISPAPSTSSTRKRRQPLLCFTSC
ncbi:hypothetical protein ACVXG7_01340 [Enterobacter hormaechei]